MQPVQPAAGGCSLGLDDLRNEGAMSNRFLLALTIVLAAHVAPVMAESPFDALKARFFSRQTVGIVSSNGRIESQTVDVATKYAGRIEAVMVAEGQIVDPGDPVARIDDRETQAQMMGARAAVMRARAVKSVAEASTAQAQSALSVAETNHDRVQKLHAEGHASDAVRDDAVNAFTSAKAALRMAEAQLDESDALIASANADLARLEIALDDLTIRAPVRGRVAYRLREPGEVLAAGAPIVTLLDLSDIYMNIYLPAADVGPLVLNDEARLILDPIPQFVIPATVTFISPEAQFTPKSVETASEREDLVFRVKLRVPPELVERFEDRVKTGVRGLGFVRTLPGTDWPADLAVKLPE
jgi:HlyD family secretion protein